jgi:hypothetical protein
LINLGVNRSDLSDCAITYFYDEDVIFRGSTCRICSANNAPAGCGTIQAEVYFSEKYRPFRGAPADLIEPVIATFVAVVYAPMIPLFFEKLPSIATPT